MVKEIGVNISKKIGRVGEFGSDMVSASITMTVENDAEVKSTFAEAWGIVKEEVEEQEKLLADKADMKESMKESEKWIDEAPAPVSVPVPAPVPTPTPASAPVEEKVDFTDPSFCGVHRVHMKERVSKYGKFYSHAMEEADGKWVYCQGMGWGVKSQKK